MKKTNIFNKKADRRVNKRKNNLYYLKKQAKPEDKMKYQAQIDFLSPAGTITVREVIQ